MGISAGLNTGGLYPGVCTSTTRPAAPYEGQMIYETDTDLTYIYSGSAWTQVSGSTAVGNSGLVYIAGVTVSAQTTTAIDNCFTSTYAHYMITYNFTSSTTGQYTALRLRAGGTAKATNYDRVGFFTTAGGVSGADGYGTAQTEIFLTGQSTTMIVGQMYIYNPQVSGRTGFNGSASYPGIYIESGSQTETYSADGFQIFASGNAATYTGTVRVYGLRQA